MPLRDPEHPPSAHLTRAALERLQKELRELKSSGRERMAERLQHARELGDIRENAEYDAAKNEQGLMEARIRTIERLLKDPVIVEAGEDAEEVAAGMVVTVMPLDEGDGADEEAYLLAASAEERHPGARTVTTESPFGKALLGSRSGDTVRYAAPGGEFSYRVVRFEPHG